MLRSSASVAAPRWLALLPILGSLLGSVSASPAGAAEFPPVTERERSLETAPGHPEAPAVVLYRNGRFTMMGALGSESHSSLRVEGRIKVLSDEGRNHGEVVVEHSDFIRLASFEGRTVLPDGREVALPADSLFQETITGNKSWYRTKAAFPALEPGAIVDYRYELRFELVSDLAPWYFHSAIPTLHSEVVYYIPQHVSAQPWSQATFGGQIRSSQKRTAQGTELKIWMDGLPPIPDEPAGLPFEDLSSSFLVVPTAIVESGTRFLLFEDWKSACDIADYSYREVRRRDGRTRARGRELAKAAGRDREAKARSIFAFVRDEIALLDLPGVSPKIGASLDDMVQEQRADHAGKGLVLEAMLDAAGLDPELVWAADRRFGRIDTAVANPAWFEAVLVRIELDGREVFLDPSDPGHGFGYLRPDLEGMEAVVYSRKKPRVIRLPTAAHDANVRRASLDLALDDDGRIAGTGEMAFEGHHGVRWFTRHRASAARAEAVADYLEERFPGFEIGEAAITEDLEAGRLEVAWTLTQSEEDVLGDEATLVPSRPLGPLSQPFTLTPAQRLTPVLLRFVDRDLVEVSVTWPPGWAAEVVPEDGSLDNGAGAYVTGVEHDEAARTLRYSRRFDTVENLFEGPNYSQLRDLYDAVAAGDARELVVIRE